MTTFLATPQGLARDPPRACGRDRRRPVGPRRGRPGRRLRRPPRRRPERRHRHHGRDRGVRPARPRRRRVPDGRQMARRCVGRRGPAIRHRQRLWRGPRHPHRRGTPRRRSVGRDRGPRHRRLRGGRYRGDPRCPRRRPVAGDQARGRRARGRGGRVRRRRCGGLRPPRDGGRPRPAGLVHAGRGDGPHQGPRGQARGPRPAAAVPDRARAVRPPNRRQQRRHAGRRAVDPAQRRGGLRGDGHGGRPRHGAGRAPRPGRRRHRRGPARHAPARDRRPRRRSGLARPQGAARRRPHRRIPAGGRARHALHLRRPPRCWGPRRVRLHRHRRRPGLHRGPRPPAHALLGRPGMRQVDPLPDRAAPAVGDRRPGRGRHPAGQRRRSCSADLAHDVAASALCDHERTATFALASVLRHFRSELDDHLLRSTCPAGVCTPIAVAGGAASPGASA